MTTQEREFELAVRSYSKDMYRFAFWLCHDHHVAEDLVQESFQRAWSHWGKLNDAVTLKKWLFSILRNEFLRRF
ncbi:sigma factor, partial [Acinetobacter baumannii]